MSGIRFDLRSLFDHVSELHRRMHVVRTLHTLPFAAIGALWSGAGYPGGFKIFLLGLVVLFGRGLSTSLLRLFKAPADVSNPESPAEALTEDRVPAAVWAAFAVHAASFLVLCSYGLNATSGHLSWLVCLGLTVHAAIRRHTGLTHFLVGLGLGAVPLGAWVALRGSLGPDALPAFVLGGGILFWAAGLDMIYSLLAPVAEARRSFRRPAWLTPGRVMALAQGCQITAILLFGLALGSALDPRAAALGTGLVAGALIVSRLTLGPSDSPRITRRFFALQLLVGPLLLIASLA
ncbi:MAG: UbiA family prenyltransferase [Planctomycetes bacterium]|nr:UbiA family prenyltransferase [Planctomycetota bacterium]